MIRRLFKKLYTRPVGLLNAQIWYVGENPLMEKATNGTMHFDPLAIKQKGRGVDFYFDFNNPKTDINLLIDYFKNNPETFERIVKNYKRNEKKLKSMIKKPSLNDFSKIFDLTCSAHLMATISVILGRQKGSEEIFKLAYRIRQKTDKVEAAGSEALLKLAAKKLPKFKRHLDVLTFDEIKSGNVPPLKELNARKSGYIFFENKIHSLSEKENLERNRNIEIFREGETKKVTREIRGAVAMKGRAIGKVRIIFEREQTKNFGEGDILVSPMTTPEFIEVIKKAGAIITDEGGITCHAAIVARELRKPCIIGTKIATKSLKDGDLVEVDADVGLVKILDDKK